MNCNVILDNEQNKLDFTKELSDLVVSSIHATLAHEKFLHECEISVVTVDNDRIRELNLEFRDIDKVTDVLSFPMLEFDGNLCPIISKEELASGDIMLGDIVISLEKAHEQAVEYGHSFERELAYLTVHSTLHLLGHDHMDEHQKEIMRGKEESVLSGMDKSLQR